MAYKRVSCKLADITNVKLNKDKRNQKQTKGNIPVEVNEAAYMPNYSKRLENHYELMCQLKLPTYNFSEDVSTYLDYFIGLHYILDLNDDTLYSFFNIYLSFLSNNKLKNAERDLAGLTSLFIAMKYEEVIFYHLDHVIKKSKLSVTRENTLEMEREILATLNYKVDFVNPLFFLKKANKLVGYDFTSREVGKFLLEFMYIRPEFVGINENVKSCTAVYLGMKIGKVDYCRTLFYNSISVTKKDMKNCLKLLILIFNKKISEYSNLIKKYSNREKQNISTLTISYLKGILKVNCGV